MQSVATNSVTLPASWRKLLLSVHVGATVSVLGADLALLVLGIAGLKGSDPQGSDPQAIYLAAHLVSSELVAPLALLSLGTGVLLAMLTPWGLLRYWWVAIKLAITVILTGAVYFVLVPRLGAAALAATAPVSSAQASGVSSLFVIAPAVASALLVLNVALAIFKPRWRLLTRGA